MLVHARDWPASRFLRHSHAHPHAAAAAAAAAADALLALRVVEPALDPNRCI